MSKYYNLVREEMLKLINKHCKDGAHDIYHLDRVYKMALYINKKENLNGDEDIICLASYMHDIHRLKVDCNEELRHSHEMGIVFYELCIRLNLHKDIIKKVKLCIECTDKHSFSEGEDYNINIPIEAIALKDSDNLDSIGAIGIARAFMFGQYINEDMYNDRIKLDDNGYNLIKKSESIIHHFYEKLLKLESDMITNSGKVIAKERTDYMENYLNKFFEEFHLS
ncbi:HD domain-containing protein [Clostridium sp.]|uniref:HD domain-containing protein n=1 Tax=Clostridium sp. TaxID=1506 RepID=UPI002FC6F02C